MISYEDILNFLRGKSPAPSGHGSASGGVVPPLTPAGRNAALQGARQAMAPKQTDESHLVTRQFGADGSVLQHSEEWTPDGTAMKVVQKDFRVVTCTGELVDPKQIRVTCFVCGGYDSVVNHCRCGIALCRRCLCQDPGDKSPLCPLCYHRALETFNTWAAQDRAQSIPQVK